jgi:membrane protein
MRVARWPDRPGSRFGLAVALLTELDRARRSEARGLSLTELSQALRVDPLQAEPIVDALVEMDWLGRLDESGAARFVLLADPAQTAAAPLIAQMLIEPTLALRAFSERAGFDRLTLAELLRS